MYFEIRKNLLKFDDVMDTQRDTIYTLRDNRLGCYHGYRRICPEENTHRQQTRGGLAALAEKDAKNPYLPQKPQFGE